MINSEPQEKQTAEPIEKKTLPTVDELSDRIAERMSPPHTKKTDNGGRVTVYQGGNSLIAMARCTARDILEAYSINPNPSENDNNISDNHRLSESSAIAISTFLNSSGFFFFEVIAALSEDPAAPQELIDDYLALLKFSGVTSRDEFSFEHSEKIALALDKYLVEGQPPPLELQSAFNRMPIWITTIICRTNPWDIHHLTGDLINEGAQAIGANRCPINPSTMEIAQRAAENCYQREEARRAKSVPYVDEGLIRPDRPSNMKGMSPAAKALFEKALEGRKRISKGDFDGYYESMDLYRRVVPPSGKDELSSVDVRDLVRMFEYSILGTEFYVASLVGTDSHYKNDEILYFVQNIYCYFLRSAGLLPMRSMLIRSAILRDAIAVLDDGESIRFSAFDNKAIIRSVEKDIIVPCHGATLFEYTVTAGRIRTILDGHATDAMLDSGMLLDTIMECTRKQNKSYTPTRAPFHESNTFWQILALRQVYSEEEIRMAGCYECLCYLEAIRGELDGIFQEVRGIYLKRGRTMPTHGYYSTTDPVEYAVAKERERAAGVVIEPLRLD